ncbi:manganese ABC transporter ATP-binding protein [candidate division KSB3 bacterium]|uniref:Manganese ABC transporter ATP-binding protein n=1 Tax=candidate division KSB3 bacterium TaxID=2044937 RepID=A0A2G6E760_9BACT|nr:MAG: manganese ABC transporter ATP-binding protein [candidate division KSB3 bacterium]PIE29980.1 MAG: manganese ABC transporter ATP-binding protein [candidate division KSB3 bacterium]
MTHNTQGPSIKFDEVGLRLGNTTILEKVSFAVAPGSIHCIIGPNGGGKTSLLRSLLGQMPHSGTISIEWPGDQTIGYVPQMLDFDRTLPITVDDFMAMICQARPAFFGLKKTHQKTVRQALELVKMTGKHTRQLGQLSGGERQRVLFAQALIPQPSLLILDEPSAGLDEAGAEIFEQILYDLRSNGVTILWIHHDLQQVKRMADMVCCINQRLLFSGNPEETMTPERILNIFSPE